MQYADNSEPPILYKKWVAVSVIASCMERKCKLEWDQDTVIYPNMYVVLVGPSGKCRKGTAMGPGYNLLREANVKMAAEAITREALIRELRKVNQTAIDPDSGMIGDTHASLTIWSQELTVFLGYNNLQLMADLSDWYDCRDRWTYRTKQQGVDEIIGVWVNLIGATTPELLRTTMPMDAIGGGLTSRMIFVYEHNKAKIVPWPIITDQDLELRRNLSADLEQIRIMKGKFSVTKEFKDRYIDWYAGGEAGNLPFEDERFSGYFERKPTHLRKLCMIMNASRKDGNMTLDVEDFDRSLDLLNQTEKKMQFTFRGVGKSEIADIVTRVMIVIGNNKEITVSDLMKRFYMDADRSTMQNVINTLVSMKFCKVVHPGEKIKYIGGNEDHE